MSDALTAVESASVENFWRDRRKRRTDKMNREQVEKTEAFFYYSFDASPYLQAHPADKAYRLQHTYRVANIAKGIAE